MPPCRRSRRSCSRRGATQPHLARNNTGTARRSGASGNSACSTSTARSRRSPRSPRMSPRVDAEEHLQQAAVHDALTGCPTAAPSPRAERDHAREPQRRPARSSSTRPFQNLDDTQGAAGDEVLRRPARASAHRSRDRHGGAPRRRRIRRALETDVRPDAGHHRRADSAAFSNDWWKGLGVRCGASSASLPRTMPAIRALLASADEAMYRGNPPADRG